MKIGNQAGLSVHFQEDGSVRSIEAAPVRISMKNATLFGQSGMNIFLRRKSEIIEFKALTGSKSNSIFAVSGNRFVARGNWDGLAYSCVLLLSDHGYNWQWNIEIINKSGIPAELDVVLVQDIGLKQISDNLVNEYYVSQYLERRILEDETYGSVICCRQNMKEPTGHPWLIMACKNGAVAGLTDGMLYYGKSFRQTGIPQALLSEYLGGEYAGESSVVALQERSFMLGNGKSHSSIFAAAYLPDHPAATSKSDLALLHRLMHEFDDYKTDDSLLEWNKPVSSVFSISGFLPVDDLNRPEIDSIFDKEQRHTEIVGGNLLSFFYGHSNHVVLRQKEILVDRPHGHIMQAQMEYVADERIVSSASFGFGAFSSHLTQGNTNFNVLLSVCASQFNQDPETGLRIFIEINKTRFLLGVPSAFEMGLNHCRWIYKYKDQIFQVRTWTSRTAPQVNVAFKVLRGKPVKIMITNQFDKVINWKTSTIGQDQEFICVPGYQSLIAGKFPHSQFRIRTNLNSKFVASGDEVLFIDYRSRDKSFLVFQVEETKDFSMSILGEVAEMAEFENFDNSDNQMFKDSICASVAWTGLSMNLSLQSDYSDILAIREILPWYGMNALTHYLTPYGLEQFSGAAWGTRDIAQGPFDFLLSMGKYTEAKNILCKIFSNQNPDGGWPQWWMFDRYSHIRSDHAHGDIYYWCIIALCDYIKVTGDPDILSEVLPYYHVAGISSAEQTPLSEHIDRLVTMIVCSFIPGTSFVPFGGGDWNDSLQPVSADLAERMISSWTVEMNYQAFNELANVYAKVGLYEKSTLLKHICERIKSDFNEHLIRDGIIAGYGLVEKNGKISVLLHPSDEISGIHYSILPMNRGIISGIFSKEQAQKHQQLIERHLKGPDGARLMDRPLKYHGGIQHIFQRAESSTFFGREIGLMYMHEHIRYAESLAIMGNAVEFLKALRQAIPVAYNEVVPFGDFRQANCYYSSSDVAFKNRYEADTLYDEIKTGKITFKGGWRIYSSGPGIYIGLIIQRLLGLRFEAERIIIDPVIPLALNGLTISFVLMGFNIKIIYEVVNDCCNPKKIMVNGKLVQFFCEENGYREGGAIIDKSKFMSLLCKIENIVVITL